MFISPSYHPCRFYTDFSSRRIPYFGLIFFVDQEKIFPFGLSEKNPGIPIIGIPAKYNYLLTFCTTYGLT